MKTTVPTAYSIRRWPMALLLGILTASAGCKSGVESDSTAPNTKAEAPESESTTEASTKDEAAEGLDTAPKDRAVTAEIAQGIEKHIAAKTKTDGGYFALSFEDKPLRLKLVRVHLEYLASLGPDRNFACVDLVDTDGEVYDVDFFMEGPPGNMVVTDTTVHKLNGKPMYAWEQNEDKTWHRVPMDEASVKLQGVIEGEDSFEFIYRVPVPKLEENARMWLPIATTDAYQTIDLLSTKAPTARTALDDAEHGNKILMIDLTPADSGTDIELRYDVKRVEKSSYPETLESPERFLQSDTLVPITDEMRKLGRAAIAGKKTDLMRARALYDHVMERMKYQKVGNEWGNGDAAYACDSRTGNCSDYHSYFIAISRAVGIPARFAVGAAIPSSRDAGDITGYHCWAEFYADGKWWPIDVSEGDKYTNLSTYYFGHHPANRIELSRGRDISVKPGPTSGPINFLAHPTLEVGGKYVRTKAKFSFQRRANP